MTTSLYRTAVEELGAIVERIDDTAVDALCAQLATARRIVVYGCGREALQIKGFAMRMFHLGLPVAVVGDMTTPPLGASDVFLCASGPGETTTVLTLMKVAKDAGADVLLLTAQPSGSAARLADFTLVLPAQTMADDRGAAATSVLPMGSAFEGALFVLFEVMVLKLRDQVGATPEAMRERHTNME